MILKLVLQLIIGIGVGIYGYLPPGYINLGMMQMAALKEKTAFWKLLIIISLIEIPYCFICMNSMQWIMQQEIFLGIIRWLIVIVLIALAVWSLYDAQKEAKIIKANTAAFNVQFRKLLVLAIFNPFQLSAWAIWGTYFIEKTWFEWTFLSIFIFSLGASLGVGIILWIYGHVGQKLIQLFSLKKKSLDYSISAILFILAMIQLTRNLSMVK